MSAQPIPCYDPGEITPEDRLAAARRWIDQALDRACSPQLAAYGARRVLAPLDDGPPPGTPEDAR